MQDIIVIAIGLGVLGYMVWMAYKTLTRKPNPVKKCDGCIGCSLQDNMDRN